MGAEQAVSEPPNLVVEPGQVCACGCGCLRVRGAVRWCMHGGVLLLLVATRSYNCCPIFCGGVGSILNLVEFKARCSGIALVVRRIIPGMLQLQV